MATTKATKRQSKASVRKKAVKPPRGVEVSEHRRHKPAGGLGLVEQALPFIQWLEEWYASLKPLPLDELISDPTRVALLSVDLINGFAYEGNLASPRVRGIIPAAVDLMRRVHARGVRNLFLIQECHSEHAEEFKAYGPHGICGTREAEMVPEFAALEFAADFQIVHKNSLHTVTDTKMERWLGEHPDVDTFIVIGDCTDLCVYDAAMDLKLRANQRDLARRVVVPETVVQTYDLPLAHAKRIGALPHVGDLQHALFLYMMALNKIEVVKSLT